MCPAQFEMHLMASVAAPGLGLVVVVGVLSTVSCPEGSFKGVGISSSGCSLVMGQLVDPLVVRM